MLKVDVLVDLFFTDEEMPARVAKIAECGYKFIETWQGGDAAALKAMADAGRDCGVELVSVVMNPPNLAEAAPVNVECRKTFVERMDEYSDNALVAGCRQGIVTTGPSVGGRSYQEQRSVLVDALREAGELVGKKGFCLNLEMLNTDVDHSGYFLDSPSDGVAIVKEVGLRNVKVLYDVYHMAILTGNVTVFIESNIEWIGHFHAAGIPGRHELADGETNYPFIVDRIEKAGYDGYFGLEYFPLLESEASLRDTLKLFR